MPMHPRTILCLCLTLAVALALPVAASAQSFTQLGGEPSYPGTECADLGVAHTGSDFLASYTVTGSVGAYVLKYNRHVSCPNAIVELAPESPMMIPASGTLTVTVQNASPIYDCNHPNLGRYESFAKVGSYYTNSQYLTYYNSRCPTVSTCAKAMSFCPQN